MLFLLQANLIDKTNGHNIRQMDRQSWCDFNSSELTFANSSRRKILTHFHFMLGAHHRMIRHTRIWSVTSGGDT